MRQSITFSFLLVLAILLVPQGQAATQCLHLANFCDTIQLENSGGLADGGWDWLCIGDWTTSSIIGNTTKARELGTRPYANGEGMSAYTAQFAIKPGKLLDLYGTTVSGIFTFQTDQPFTITTGACRAADVDRSKPRLISNVKRKLSLHNLSTTHCIHFRNFCDTILVSKGSDEFAALAYGAWDWQCEGDWQNSNIMGNATPEYELATRPVYTPNDFIPFPYTVQFSFKPGRIFDLYETSGPGSLFTTRTNEPFTISNGACTFGDIDPSKPTMMNRR